MLNFLLNCFRKKRPVAIPQPVVRKVPSESQIAKQEALQQAEQLSGNDMVIADFVLQCRFADARFVAAQKIQTKEAQEKVKAALQKSDRRVYRLMQDRLNEQARSDKFLSDAKKCIEKAVGLVNEPGLTPNLVAELDREWKKLVAADNNFLPISLKAEFDSLHSQLMSRLALQLALQREMKMADSQLSTIASNNSMTPDERSAALDEIDAKIIIWKQSSEWLAMPRQVCAAIDANLEKLKRQSDQYVQEYQSVMERVGWLEKWESQEAADLKKDEIEKIWKELPKVRDAEQLSELNARYENVLCRAIVEVADIGKSLPKLDLSANEAQKYFDEHMHAMQQAVEAGLVHEALIHEEALNRLDAEVLSLPDEQKNQLAELKSEIRRLKGWAKWGGQQSREKLIRFVESLIGQDLPVDELSSAIVNAREQWKSLTAVSGAAAKNQWIEFDTLCNRAYEPVLLLAKKQADERQENVLKAEAIIENARVFIRDLGESFSEENENRDWKTIINFYRQISQVWRQIGMVGRAEKKRLDDAFSAVLQPVRDALYKQSQLEVELREKLIGEVLAIDPESRDAGKQLKEVQQKWQTYAKNFPLDNREDKKLWSRFREVCENLHGKRMEKNKAVDLERHEHLHQKEAICAELETLQMEGAGDLERQLNQLLKRWDSIGSVSRDVLPALEKRLGMAVSAVREKIAHVQAEKLQEALQSLPEKLRLCAEVEKRMAAVCEQAGDLSLDVSSDDEEYDSAWKALPVLPEKLENVLSHRFYNGLKAIASLNMGYGKRLADNTLPLKETILRCEIVYGIDSPDELLQERLLMQVKVLQDSLGGDHLQAEEVMKQLLEWPALMDEADIRRISNLVLQLKKPG